MVGLQKRIARSVPRPILEIDHMSPWQFRGSHEVLSACQGRKARFLAVVCGEGASQSREDKQKTGAGARGQKRIARCVPRSVLEQIVVSVKVDFKIARGFRSLRFQKRIRS